MPTSKYNTSRADSSICTWHSTTRKAENTSGKKKFYLAGKSQEHHHTQPSWQETPPEAAHASFRLGQLSLTDRTNSTDLLLVLLQRISASVDVTDPTTSFLPLALTGKTASMGEKCSLSPRHTLRSSLSWSPRGTGQGWLRRIPWDPPSLTRLPAPAPDQHPWRHLWWLKCQNCPLLFSPKSKSRNQPTESQIMPPFLLIHTPRSSSKEFLWYGDCGSVVEPLPGMSEALASLAAQ